MATVVARVDPYTSYKSLPSVNLGGTNVRFLSVGQTNIVTFPSSLSQLSGRIVFLGCDVLTGTSVAKKNYIRIHNRYSKDGFATKLSLEGFKVEGINNSSTMWFYSIQGLFKVAFELHSTDTQRDCLLKFKDIWLAGTVDEPLAGTGVARCQEEKDTSVQCISTDSELPAYVKDSNTNVKDSNMNVKDSNMNPASPCATENPPQQQMNSDTVIRQLINEVQPSCHGNTPEVSKKVKIEAKDFMDQLVTFVKESLLNVDDNLTKTVLFQILTTLEYLQYISVLKTNHFTEWGVCVFEIMQQYLQLSKQNTLTPTGMFKNTFGLEHQQYILLYVISEWVGKEYHKMESQISTEVEDFKKQNISSLDNLPPAENMIDILFPSCMKQLLIKWIDVPGNSTTLSNSCHRDHTGSPPCKIQRDNKDLRSAAVAMKPMYSMVQLILEFACNSLVSGVAHVVYTRLRHTM